MPIQDPFPRWNRKGVNPLPTSTPLLLPSGELQCQPPSLTGFTMTSMVFVSIFDEMFDKITCYSPCPSNNLGTVSVRHLSKSSMKSFHSTLMFLAFLRLWQKCATVPDMERTSRQPQPQPLHTAQTTREAAMQMARGASPSPSRL